jgi:uncharacterized phage-associated protein
MPMASLTERFHSWWSRIDGVQTTRKGGAKMAKAIDAARHILAKARVKGIQLDPMRLQKMLYFSHGWGLALNNGPLFEEMIEAWPYGPVVAPVYYEFKNYGACVIPDFEDKLSNLIQPESDNIINQVLDIYGRYNGPTLSGMTHQGGSPWRETYKEGYRSLKIPNDLIRNYFNDMKINKRIC